MSPSLRFAVDGHRRTIRHSVTGDYAMTRDDEKMVGTCICITHESFP